MRANHSIGEMASLTFYLLTYFYILTETMNESIKEEITLYSSNWCTHSLSVERYLARNNIAVKQISIDGNEIARHELIEINGGYASVPTLIFPDGSKLTEPSFAEIRRKLDIEASPGLFHRVRTFLGGESDEHGK
jgi:mycoredoxin